MPTSACFLFQDPGPLWILLYSTFFLITREKNALRRKHFLFNSLIYASFITFYLFLIKFKNKIYVLVTIYSSEFLKYYFFKFNILYFLLDKAVVFQKFSNKGYNPESDIFACPSVCPTRH